MKTIRHDLRFSALVLSLLLTTFAVTPLMAQDWPMFGQDVTNDATASQTSLTTGNVGRLAPKWIFTTGGDVSARAALVNGVLYFPDWTGHLYAVNANSGRLIWSHLFSDYGLSAGTVSRGTPTVANGVLYVGTQYNSTGTTGWMLAIDAYSGHLIWKTQPDTSNSFPVITTSPAYAEGVLYFGMTSDEEFAAANPSYPCCSARGSVVALDAFTGHKLWQTFTVPASGYSGAAIWGSNPVVDVLRGTVFVGTGDNYSHPTDPTYLACIAAGGTEAHCLPASDHVDSILALDMWTGHIKWAQKMVTWNQYGVSNGSDDWNVGCAFGDPTVRPISPMSRLAQTTTSARRRTRSPITVEEGGGPSSAQARRAGSTMLSILTVVRCYGRRRSAPVPRSAVWSGVQPPTAAAST